MRRIAIAISLLFALAFLSPAAHAQYEAAPAQDQGEVLGSGAVGAFYDALIPYGNWIYADTCGWVWYPYNVPVDWRPYTNGQWQNTDAGWTFVSYDPWGWAVYHYGRWYFDNTYGWVWCPGLTWGSSWVAWRRSDDYIGWAPIPPTLPWQADQGFVTSGIDVQTYFPTYSWCFVPYDSFPAPNCSDFLVLPARNVTIISLCPFFFDFDFDRDRHFGRNRFRDEDDFERRFHERTGHKIDHFRLGRLDAPGIPQIQGDELRVFRPDLRTRDGRLQARELPIGHANTRPSELTFRQDDERRVLDDSINMRRSRLNDAHREELQSVPRGLTPDQMRSRQDAEMKDFDSQADTQRQLLQNMHQREDRMWLAPSAPPRRRFDTSPEVRPGAVSMGTTPAFPRPVFERGPMPGEGVRGGTEMRGGETRGTEGGRPTGGGVPVGPGVPVVPGAPAVGSGGRGAPVGPGVPVVPGVPTVGGGGRR